MEPPLIDLKLQPQTRLFMMKCMVGLYIFIFAVCAYQVCGQLESLQEEASHLQNEVGTLSQKDVDRVRRSESSASLIIDLQLVIMASVFVGLGCTAYMLGKYSTQSKKY